MINDCIICLENIKDDDIFITKCCHYYHFKCFLKYIKYNLGKIQRKNHIECPLCRTENELKYIMYDLITKIYDYRIEMKNLEKKKRHLKNNLMLLNIKNCLYFKKRNSIDKEEIIMEEIEVYNCEINKKKSESENIRKVYFGLINRFK